MKNLKNSTFTMQDGELAMSISGQRDIGEASSSVVGSRIDCAPRLISSQCRGLRAAKSVPATFRCNS